MPSDEYGICGPAGPPWSSTVTCRPYSALPSLRTGKRRVSRLGELADVSRSYQIATGSGDDTIRIWDIRSLKALYTIPAHTSNVSEVRFFNSDDLPSVMVPHAPEDTEMNDTAEDADQSNDNKTNKAWTPDECKYRSGLYFASSGYDGLVKLWSADDWQLLHTLTTDSGKVMSVDLSPDGGLLASGTYNRNYQLFAPESVPV